MGVLSKKNRGGVSKFQNDGWRGMLKQKRAQTFSDDFRLSK